MKSVTYDSLGLRVTFSAPESPAEYDTLAKRANACLDDAIANVAYRGVLTAFRKAFVARLVAVTGIARLTKKVTKGKNADGTDKVVDVPDETEADYVERVVLSKVASDGLTEAAALASLQPIADEVMSATNEDGTLKIAFDPAVAEGGAARKPTKEALAIVANLRKDGKFDAAAAKLAAKFGATVPTTDDELALLVAEQLRQSRDEAAKAAAAGISAL